MPTDSPPRRSLSPPVPTSCRAQALLVLFGIVAGLATVELVLHFALPSYGFHFPSFRMTDDRLTKRAEQSNADGDVHYAFDADGFRKSGTAVAAAARTVLFIGDSFTQGFGVQGNESFPAVTCEQLAKRGLSVRCVNAGVTGFGTAHELRLLRRLLRQDALQVGAVVFQVLPNNDLSDNWEDGGFGLDGQTLVVRDPPRIPFEVRLRDALLDNSFARGSRLVTLGANAWFKYSGMNPRCDAGALQLEQRLLQEAVTTVQQRGIPIVMLVCATAWEVDRARSAPCDDRDRLDRVVAAVQQLQVPWIDSRNVARAPADYNPDGHFSPAGDALIGALLAERLAPLLEK